MRVSLSLVLAVALGCANKSQPASEHSHEHEHEAGRSEAPGSAAIAPPVAATRVAPAIEPPIGTRYDRVGDPGHGHPIDITLRSSPPGATASVDGVVVGATPAYWSGTADGHEHEFTFVAPGHAVARYRFVPITSGVIHARLERVAEEPSTGAPDDEPEAAPQPRAGAVLVDPPPAPIAKPDATGEPAAPTPAPAPAPQPSGGMGPQP